jgi:IS4 transposase
MQFTAVRAVKLLFKLFLEIIDEIRVENNVKLDELNKTLEDLEIFLKKEHGISISLTSYMKYSNVLDDHKMKQLRKRVLDYGNSLLREIETQR